MVANGDITTPEKAKFVLEYTGADAVMIGRAAQGRPWIFREIAHFLATGTHLPPPAVEEIRDVTIAHLHELHSFYGYERGVRVARKHISWYTKGLKNSAVFRARMNTRRRSRAAARRGGGVLRPAARAIPRDRIRRRQRGRACSLNTGAGPTRTRATTSSPRRCAR